MPQAKIGDTVKVHYTGRLEDGTVFDSSLNREPLQFTIGAGELIPGFEESVIGMEVGEKKTVTIPPEKAYGSHLEELVIKIEKERIPEDINPEVGQQLEIKQPDGRTIPVVVTDISETHITLDANHPLAGESLTFDIELVEIVA